jgi:uncharacterized protein YfbU (UPF0304 family)
MKKLNRKQYEALMTVLVAAREARITEIEQAIAALNDSCPLSVADLINEMHDAVSDAERRIKDLEHAWDTRNYTTADWTSRELIINNVD